MQALGATIMPGSSGNFTIPTVTGDAASYWVAEDTDITMSNFSVGQLTLTPHTVGAATALSRRFLLQSVTSAETFVRRELASILALAIDKAALGGTGTGEPFGVAHVTGVTAIPMCFSHKRQREPQLHRPVLVRGSVRHRQCRLRCGGVGYNPVMRQFCKITPKTTAITAGMLMEPGRHSCAGAGLESGPVGLGGEIGRRQ